jgi:hypothetical protein
VSFGDQKGIGFPPSGYSPLRIDQSVANKIAGTASLATLAATYTSTGSSATLRHLYLNPTISMASSTGSYTAIQVDVVENVLPSASGTGNFLLRLRAGSSGTTDIFNCDNAGAIAIGATAPWAGYGFTGLDLAGTSTNYISARCASTSATTSASCSTVKSRGTVAAPSAIQSGDQIGRFSFVGYGTSAWQGATCIAAYATETWTNTSAGSDLAFIVTANSGGSATEKWRAKGSGIFQGYSSSVYAWTNGSDSSGSADLGVSRNASGVLAIGNGTANDHSGKIQMNGTTGASSLTITSTNFPGVNTGSRNPYTWLTFVAPDGTTVYVPAFK